MTSKRELFSALKSGLRAWSRKSSRGESSKTKIQNLRTWPKVAIEQWNALYGVRAFALQSESSCCTRNKISAFDCARGQISVFMQKQALSTDSTAAAAVAATPDGASTEKEAPAATPINRRKVRARKAPIIVTKNAANRVAELLEQSDDNPRPIGVRLGVRSRGTCACKW